MSETKNTCGTCAFLGGAYWGDRSDYGGRTHFCKKSDERRRDEMKPTGDRAEDFMQNFRTFFDAHATRTACGYYEERAPLAEADILLLAAMRANNERGAFGFFSQENRTCERMDGWFVERDRWASQQRAASDGTRDWRLTMAAVVTLNRIAATRGVPA